MTPDVTVLVLRFIFGALLGAFVMLAVTIPMIWVGVPNVMRTMLPIGGAVTLIVALSATIWGDRFLLWFMKIFKILQHLNLLFVFVL
jgi:hypothetical protein